MGWCDDDWTGRTLYSLPARVIEGVLDLSLDPTMVDVGASSRMWYVIWSEDRYRSVATSQPKTTPGQDIDLVRGTAAVASCFSIWT